MTKNIPISERMIRLTYSVDENMKLSKAESLMQKLGIRHLPVLRDGILVGILSERDIKSEEAWVGSKTDLIAVHQAMHRDPYAVKAETSIHEVVFEMARRKLGCAIVVGDQGKVEGIFTCVDAMRLLSELEARMEVDGGSSSQARFSKGE